MTDQLKILVVDDDPQITAALRLRLEACGYMVVTRGDGESALEVAHTLAIDAIITDITMPIMDGEEMLRRLQDTGLAARLPVIVLTTNLSADQRQRFVELGANHCVAKPYDSASLIALLHSTVRDRAIPTSTPSHTAH